MTPKPTVLRYKLLFFVLLSSIGLIVLLPRMTVEAQACNPGEPTHVIGYGETYQSIANYYGVTRDALLERNGILSYTKIYLGATLCIPAGGSVSPNTQPGVPQPQLVIPQPVVQVVVVTATPFPNVYTSPTINTVPLSTNRYTRPVASGEENWCFAGGPWGDGRCIVPDNPDLQAYWWLAGWCNAQVELGNYPGTVDACLDGVTRGKPVSSSSGGTTSTSPTNSTVIISNDESDDFDFDRVDDDDDFACTIIYDESSGKVTSLAKWDDDFDDQDKVTFYTDLPNLYSYSVDVDADDEQIGIIQYTDTYRSFDRGSAKITFDHDDDDDDDDDNNTEDDNIDQIGVLACERITDD